jgi:hypothetical protein
LRSLDRQAELCLMPAQNADAKARFLAELEREPVPERLPSFVSTRHPPAPAWNSLAYPLTAAAALLIGIGIGWLGWSPGPNGLRDGTGVGGAAETRVTKEAEDKLVARLVDHNLRLAESVDPLEQFHLLNAVATDLRSEAIRLARQTAPEDLPLLTALYEQVLRRGVVGRARSLPAPQRQALAKQLGDTQAEIRGSIQDVPPALAEFLRPLLTVSEQVSQTIQADGDSAPAIDAESQRRAPAAFGTSRGLVTVLVSQALLMAEEDDPLHRVGCCNDVADQLSLAILVASSRGDTDRASRLTRHLQEILDRPVTTNLDRLQEANDPRLARLQQVVQRANHAVKALESSLARPPGGNLPERKQGPDWVYEEQARELEKALKDVEKSLKEIAKEKKDANRKEVKGVVKSVDAAAGTLVLGVRDKNMLSEISFRLAADVKIRIPPRDGTLADVKPGTPVKAQLDETDSVIELKLEMRSTGEKSGPPGKAGPPAGKGKAHP